MPDCVFWWEKPRSTFGVPGDRTMTLAELVIKLIACGSFSPIQKMLINAFRLASAACASDTWT